MVGFGVKEELLQRVEPATRCIRVGVESYLVPCEGGVLVNALIASRIPNVARFVMETRAPVYVQIIIRHEGW